MKVTSQSIKKSTVSWALRILTLAKDAIFAVVSPFRLWLTGGVLLALLVTGFLWNWNHEAPPPPVDKPITSDVAWPMKGVEHEKVEMKVPVIVYGGGEKPKRQLKLTPEMVKDDTKKIIAASTIAPSNNPTDVVSVLDEKTGKVETVQIRKAKDWFAFHKDGAVGLAAGVSDLGETARLYARQRAFSIKNMDFGGMVSFDQPLGPVGAPGGVIAGPRYFIGLTAEWKWD